ASHRPADQGHAVRHQGDLARGLRAARGGPGAFRRLRSLRRLRSHLRRGQAQPPHRGDSRPLSRALLRDDQHHPLRRRVAPPPHVRQGRRSPLLRGMTEAEVLARHRAVWEARPELRQVYREWFARLLGAVEGLDPVVEVGAGPGFLKEFAPHLVATDVVAGLRVRVREGALPLRLLSAEPFIGLPYLVTFGFKVERPLPPALQRLARLGEVTLGPLRRWLATRTLVVLEKPALASGRRRCYPAGHE